MMLASVAQRSRMLFGPSDRAVHSLDVRLALVASRQVIRDRVVEHPTATGDRSSRPLRPEHFRPYLKLIARAQFGRHRGARFDDSDIVQETLLEAHRKFEQFRGTTEAELAAWLRKLLACTLADAVRRAGRAKRDAARERSLERSIEDSCSRVTLLLGAMQTSPSVRLQRDEDLIRLAIALEGLPELQRTAVELHHLQGLSLAETAATLGRTEPAIAGLLRRGLKALRARLDESDT